MLTQLYRRLHAQPLTKPRIAPLIEPLIQPLIAPLTKPLIKPPTGPRTKPLGMRLEPTRSRPPVRPPHRLAHQLHTLPAWQKAVLAAALLCAATAAYGTGFSASALLASAYSEVPEPPVYIMLLIGVGLLGLVARRESVPPKFTDT